MANLLGKKERSFLLGLDSAVCYGTQAHLDSHGWVLPHSFWMLSWDPVFPIALRFSNELTVVPIVQYDLQRTSRELGCPPYVFIIVVVQGTSLFLSLWRGVNLKWQMCSAVSLSLILWTYCFMVIQGRLVISDFLKGELQFNPHFNQ